MARRRKRAPKEPEYDPGIGQSRNLAPSLKHPGIFGVAEHLTEQRLTGLENPPPELSTRPAARDVLAAAIMAFANRPPSGGDGWGAAVYEKPVYKGRGMNRRLHHTWRLPAGVLAALIVVYGAERIMVGMSNWWPGSSLGVSSWANAVNPAGLIQWTSQHVSVQSLNGAIQSLTAVPL